MPSSFPTASTTRSPSPHTPEASDNVSSVTVHSNIPFSLDSWSHPSRQLSFQEIMDAASANFLDPPSKLEENSMLRLDELLEQHAFDDHAESPPQGPNENLSYPSSPPASPLSTHGALLSTRGLVSHNPPMAGSMTKPVPPPAIRPRLVHPFATSQKVVYPPKESCYNLPIMLPSIPEGGTKSRVETQVRVTVDLADTCPSFEPHSYNRVGTWKWLKLPPGTATKKRTRKQGKIDPDPDDILHLAASVSCASPPHNPVLSCSSCQAREAKRVAKKIAARVRPARSDSDSPHDPSNPSAKKSRYHEDTTSIIQFNCAEVLDFSTGSVVLPLRITCYCRHHREKVGFLVHLTMMDRTGRIVGTGISRPIMITDDHKTTGNSLQTPYGKDFPVSGMYDMDQDWSQGRDPLGDHHALDTKAPSKRTRDAPSGIPSRPRAKPYDSSAKHNKRGRQPSESSLPSPSTTHSPLSLTRSPTPPSVDPQTMINSSSSADALSPSSQPPVDISQRRNSSHESEASSDTLVTPDDHGFDVTMLQPTQLYQPVVTNALIPNILHPTCVIPNSQSMPLMFFDPAQSMTLPPLPIIHRLIPSCGPTHGGIEVTILGANFHSNMQLNCVFGDAVASSTSRWSDNTLVCLLPPRATAGVVAVWFDGIPKSDDPATSSLSLFTYTDDSDRALMELALQVVGLKMTGKIEDAKNVAMRIVGSTANDGAHSQNGLSANVLQSSTSTSPQDMRSLLFSSGKTEDFETLITDFLAILESPVQSSSPLATSAAISYPNSSGQTLLHLAAFLGFNSLAALLIRLGADLDTRDRNGCTPLHLAAIGSNLPCATLLCEAGADSEIVNALGKTSMEVVPIGVQDVFASIVRSGNHLASAPRAEDQSADDDDDDEARWGDAEGDSDDGLGRMSRRLHHRLRRTSHRQEENEDPIAGNCSSGSNILNLKAEEKSERKSEDLHKVDEKQAASFIDLIQRTFATLQPQGIIPNMSQLPLPQLRQLSELGMPAVPWGAIPQIPVFPVFVPIPGWPSFRAKEPDAMKDGQLDVGDKKETAQEWRTVWEKWISLASVSAEHATEPPPEYTPRAEHGSQRGEALATEPANEVEPEAGPSSLAPSRVQSTSDTRSPSRRPDYSHAQVDDRDVNAYAYRPSSKQTQKMQKKHDKMLFSFWLPVLLFGILYLLYIGMHFFLRAAKYSVSPLKLKLTSLMNL